ncbi:MAG TPA: NADH-quinone oxidoreductase subunit J, partial [Stellaceae bacterium]|nr:NADH-quinone oxidoreductase subunit J [Stellaceae bacterium]
LPAGGFVGFLLLAELLLIFGNWTLASQAAGAPQPAGGVGLTNTRALGDVLYTQYLLAFQAAGLILLVAMIGAIVLTLRRRPDVRRQRIGVQIARTRTQSVEVVKLPIGGGVSGQ